MGVVYEALDRETGVLVALKTLTELDAERIYLLKQEFRELAEIVHPNLIRLGELHGEDDHWFFTMELLDARDFRAFVCGEEQSPAVSQTAITEVAVGPRTAPLADADEAPPETPSEAPARGFDEARLREGLGQLARGVEALHQVGKLHRDLKPSNVLVDRDGRVVIVDFGLVRRFAPTEHTPQTWEKDAIKQLAGTYAYMAPEQMMGFDYGPAADWFAVGVMLFEVLAGEKPYVGTVPQILFAKSRGEPPDPADFRPELAGSDLEDLRALCRDLLRADPDDRPTGPEVLAKLGADHRAAGPGPSATFAGRAAELDVLDAARADVARGAQPRAVLVVGDAGVGKTSLVERFLSGTRPRPTVFRGRCYEKETLPFKAFDRIVDQLTRYLAHHEDSTRHLAGELHLAAALFLVLRRVKWLRDVPEPSMRFDNVEQIRQAAFQSLKRIFADLATREELVLFVDDLQWTDDESLDLLDVLLTDPAPPLLFVATARDALEDRLPARVALRVQAITLGGLSASDAGVILAELLPDSAGVSMQRLIEDSGGHPLFLRELARLAATHEGEWNDLRLEDAIVRRVDALGATERALLEHVALAGAPIPATVLLDLGTASNDECMRALRALRAEDLISDYRLDGVRVIAPYHDRVRESLHAELLEAPARARQMELALGRALLARAGDDPAWRRRAADLLLSAREAVEPAERQTLRSLLREVGRASLTATSYGVAKRYLEQLEALSEDEWNTNYDERLQLGRDLMTCAYQLRDADDARARREALIERARSDLDRARVHALWASLESSRRHCEAAIEAGRAGLAELGITIPRTVTPPVALKEHLTLRWLRGRRSIPALADTAPLDDPRRLTEAEVLSVMTGPAFFVDSQLLAWLLMRLSVISLRDGLMPVSGFAFAGYGLVLSGVFERHDEAQQWGQLARTVDARSGGHRFGAKVGLLNGTFIDSWVNPLPEVRADLARAIQAGLEHGDPEFVSYCVVSTALFHVLEGGPLDAMREAIASLDEVAETIGDHDASVTIEILLAHLGRLAGVEPRRDLATIEAELSDEGTPAAIFWFHVFAAWEAVFRGDFAAAAASLEHAAPRQARTFGFAMGVDYTLLELIVAARRPGRGAVDRAKRLVAVRRRLQKLRGWAEWREDSFGAHRWIGEAVCADLEGRRVAAKHWAHALRDARAFGNLRAAAIAETLCLARDARSAPARWGVQGS